jgi:protein SCO1/2
MKRLALFFPLLAILAACGPPRAELPRYNTVPPFVLTDQAGREFSSAAALAGRVWVADFIFTTCTGPCPRMSARMYRLQQDTSGLDGLTLVSFTVDPDTDTPPVLAAYAAKFQADASRWFFLTGARETLHRLNRDVFMLGDVGDKLDHSTRFVLVDRKGAVRGYYLSSDADAMRRLTADIRSLLREPA